MMNKINVKNVCELRVYTIYTSIYAMLLINIVQDCVSCRFYLYLSIDDGPSRSSGETLLTSGVDAWNTEKCTPVCLRIFCEDIFGV